MNMKLRHVFLLSLFVLLLSSCSEKTNKGKFQPKDRTSTNMSIEERDAAIAQKRSELGVNLDTLLYSHGVKFTILRPNTVGEDITEDIAERISVKMLQIASQNGISGVGTDPGIAMGVEITQNGRAATGTAPQKMTVKYNLTFKVVNTASGDVYATATQDVLGVGNSFPEANINAVNEIKNTPAMQKMLQTASERIIAWYNNNLQTVKNHVEKAEGEGNYALALGLVSSIPEQATKAHQYATAKQPQLLKGMLHKQAADMLGEMEALMASAGDEFNPAIGAYFRLIPTDCPEHKTAQAHYAVYDKKCRERKAALEAKAERDERAAQELQKVQMLYDHEEELATIEADKIKSKFQSMAAAKARSGNRGLFGSIGYAISGVAERVFKVADVAGAVLTDKMGLQDYVDETEFM